MVMDVLGRSLGGKMGCFVWIFGVSGWKGGEEVVQFACLIANYGGGIE